MPDARKRSGGSDAPGSKKRKTDKDLQKYYAVRTGLRPGVYLTWLECQKQTTGFPGATCKTQPTSHCNKSFLSRDDAEAFVAGKNPTIASSSNGNPPPPKFYAVARGAFTGIFLDWETARPAISGVKGPKYKKFETMREAVEFIEEYGDAETIAKVKGQGGSGAATTRKTTVQTDATAVNGDMMAIYTDGSSLSNGRRGAAAGVGVFFGTDDPRNVSERLLGEPQTNQRAELTAILRALEISPESENVQIFTDSQYSINCVTVWYKAWVKKDWHTSTGEPVKNKDLVQAVRERIEAREEEGSKTVFTWVKGHSENPGNVAADRLAVAGAQLPG
ncbi:putative ribonuclease H [Sodiomyces alkalinus F11]|uniref:Ribonuclease H n=1 Tax=Sodiomyces alkalinus (strain CBS 110278 / VKM F-3762 / F11) TaxID=1314773 RepID=A0A3N2Q0S9_SODAK|nr:putative ribonuclease H [Sodiomyces alkalinus F11]ROT40306.1 putative ribonuclease H [Sodiomyces alkalinus F11]